MNTSVAKIRQRLFLLLAATIACTALTACDEDDHRVAHTSHGYHRGHDRDDDHDDDDRRRTTYHDDRRVSTYHRDDDRHDTYRRDGYYGGSARGTSTTTIRREAPVVRERSVSYSRY